MVQHPTLIRSAIANLICGALNGGTLVLLTKTGAPVAALTFSDPAFSPAVDGVATAREIIADPSAVGGTVARAVALDSNGNPVFGCDVSLIGDGAPLQLSSLQAKPGEKVSIIGLTYTALP
jgi:hypothetical protein